MKVLYITELFPFPLDTGGKIRTFYILDYLVSRHDVTLVTCKPADPEVPVENFPLASRCKVVTVEPTSRWVKTVLRVLAIASNRPAAVYSHFNPRIRAALKELGSDTHEPFDRVHYDHLDATIYRGVLGHVPAIVDLHNVVSNQVATSLKESVSWPIAAALKLQLKPTVRYEKRVLAEAEGIIMCSEADQVHVQKIHGLSPRFVVPNGVDTDFFVVPDCSEKNDTSAAVNAATTAQILFFGTLDYGPGAAGVKWYLRKVAPELEALLDTAKHIFIGQNPSEELLGFSCETIAFPGRVEDIRPYARDAKVFITPLLSGSGTRLKILTAMAMGLPVVSTTIGAEGLDVTHGVDILIADEPAEFAKSIARVIHDDSLARKIAANGRQLVEEQYAWTTVTKSLDLLYSKAEA